MNDDSSLTELQIELRRELERLGLTPDEAETLSGHRFAAARDDAQAVRQHVVPVSRGWVVMRDFPNQDVGLFSTKEEALLEAHALADPAGSSVVVHDEDS